MKIKTVDITPDKSLMPKLAYTGYTLPQAIAEFIDNSIDAHASIPVQEGRETLKVFIHIKKNYISIKDNSAGMAEQQLIDAMTLARSHKQDQIGRFGLGMKTASLSLGGKFTIRTKQQGEIVHTTTYDESRWLRRKDLDWSIDIRSQQTEDLDSYTRVKIEKLKQPYHRYVEKLQEDIARRYAPFLRRNTLVIKVNSKSCKPKRAKLIKGSKKELEISLTGAGDLFTKFDNTERIHGWYGLTEDILGGSYYGFTLFWKGRMISYYDKIGIGESVANTRIVGEVHLDFLDVTHNKREFIKDTDEYRAVERVLTQEFKDLVIAARTLADDQAMQLALSDKTNQWLHKLTKAFVKSKQLNDLSLFSNLQGDILQPSSKGDGTKQATEIEKRSSKLLDALQEDVTEEATPQPEENLETPTKEEKKRKPRKKKVTDKHTIKVKGRRFDFTHKYVKLGEQAMSKSYDIEEGRGTINIYTNIDFPAFSATTDKPFYSVMLIASVLAEVFVQRFGLKEYTVDEIHELILRETSLLGTQENSATDT